MIDSFSVKNFRCFEDVNLQNLRRVNVIVGKNAAGKTALLEAVRLALGATPQVAFQLNNYRGVSGAFGPGMAREQFEALWNSLFFKFDTTRVLSTEVTDSSGHVASLAIRFDPSRAITPTQLPHVQTTSTFVPIQFDRTTFAGEHSVLFGTVLPQGQLSLEPGVELGLATEFFASSWVLNQQLNAQWFSQLSLENREKEVVSAIKKEFDPLILDVQILSLSQFVPASVYATVPFVQMKMPLSLLSAGITKFFSLLAAIIYRKGGVVLIDEVENGLYYERLPALWTTLLKLAKENDTQLFVSTHSDECLQALVPLIKENEDDFMLLRAERKNGSSGIAQFGGDEFEAALARHGEVR